MSLIQNARYQGLGWCQGGKILPLSQRKTLPLDQAKFLVISQASHHKRLNFPIRTSEPRQPLNQRKEGRRVPLNVAKFLEKGPARHHKRLDMFQREAERTQPLNLALILLSLALILLNLHRLNLVMSLSLKNQYTNLSANFAAKSLKTLEAWPHTDITIMPGKAKLCVQSYAKFVTSISLMSILTGISVYLRPLRVMFNKTDKTFL